MAYTGMIFFFLNKNESMSKQNFCNIISALHESKVVKGKVVENDFTRCLPLESMFAFFVSLIVSNSYYILYNSAYSMLTKIQKL